MISPWAEEIFSDAAYEINEVDKNLSKSLKFLNLYKGNALEIGCGKGDDAIFLSQNGFNTDAIDINQNYIDIATSKNSNVNFICGDVFNNIPDKKYDLIYDRGLLHNISYNAYRSIFELLHRKMNQNGKLIIITGHPNMNLIKKLTPPPTPYYEVVLGFRDYFDVKLIKEIDFKLNKKFDHTPLGIIYILSKIS